MILDILALAGALVVGGALGYWLCKSKKLSL
jgi:hypothetical protein